jgi:hypothetical protein
MFLAHKIVSGYGYSRLTKTALCERFDAIYVRTIVDSLIDQIAGTAMPVNRILPTKVR